MSLKNPDIKSDSVSNLFLTSYQLMNWPINGSLMSFLLSKYFFVTRFNVESIAQVTKVSILEDCELLLRATHDRAHVLSG